MTTPNPTLLTVTQTKQLFRWRTSATNKMPYLAPLIWAVTVVNTPGSDQMFVDQHHRVYIDFDTVQNWPETMIVQGFLHEIGHLVADHFNQATHMAVTDPTRFNIAADLSINDDLFDVGCHHFADTGPFETPTKHGLPVHQTVAYYYNELQPTGDGTNTCGTGSGGTQHPHEIGDPNHPLFPAPPPQIVEHARTQIVRNITHHEHQHVPPTLVETILTTQNRTTQNWDATLRNVLGKHVAQTVGTLSPTYTKPNRRLRSIPVSGGRALLPGKEGLQPVIGVVRDVSASMDTTQLGLATSIITEISEQLGVTGQQLIVVDCNTAVLNETTYRGPQTVLTTQTGGNTDLTAGVNYLVSHPTKPTLIVVLTDGYTPWPAPTRTPVLTAILAPTLNSDNQPPAWVEVVHCPPGAAHLIPTPRPQPGVNRNNSLG